MRSMDKWARGANVCRIVSVGLDLRGGRGRRLRDAGQAFVTIIGETLRAGEIGQRRQIAAGIIGMRIRGERRGQRAGAGDDARQSTSGGFEGQIGIEPVRVSEPQRPSGRIIALRDHAGGAGAMTAANFVRVLDSAARKCDPVMVGADRARFLSGTSAL